MINNCEAEFFQRVANFLRRRTFCSYFSRQNDELCGLQSQLSELDGYLKRLSQSRESSSVLIEGARGSGKSMLFESVWSDYAEGSLLLFRLNGLWHTEDKFALRDILNQLACSYSHLNISKYTDNIEDCLATLFECLAQLSDKVRGFVFLLEEFDLFATHRHQSLLYGLFNAVQTVALPILVIGTTVRSDVNELLEKRVRSRFSHRYIRLTSEFSFDEYLQFTGKLLCLPDSFDPKNKRLVTQWNKHIEGHLLDTSDWGLRFMLKKTYETDKSIAFLKRSLALTVCKLKGFFQREYHVKEDGQSFMYYDFYPMESCIEEDTVTLQVASLSKLEQCLLVAIKHTADRLDPEPFNFEMAFREYDRFVSLKWTILKLDREVVLKAYEHLQTLNIIQPVQDGLSRGTLREFQMTRLHISQEQLEDALIEPSADDDAVGAKRQRKPCTKLLEWLKQPLASY